MIDVVTVTFYTFAALLLGSASMVVFTRHAVSGVMALIVSFIASTVLWLLLHAEFLGLALLFVYVGAVMTLFLFVVMMLNVKIDASKARLLRYFPLALMLGVVLVGMLWLVVGPHSFGLEQFSALGYGADYDNTRELGMVLYTDYVVPLELAAAILLVAIISAIGLAFRGAQQRRGQKVPEQVMTKKASQLRLVTMVSESEDDA
jgi:NADH-quinone oxidoreductase subunit J